MIRELGQKYCLNGSYLDCIGVAGEHCQDSSILVPQKAALPTTGIKSMSYSDFPQQPLKKSISQKLRHFFTPRQIFPIRRTQSVPTQPQSMYPKQQPTPNTENLTEQFSAHLQVTKENIEEFHNQQEKESKTYLLEDKISSEENENEKLEKRVRFQLPEKAESENEWDDVSFSNDSLDVEDQFQRIMIRNEKRCRAPKGAATA
eukprot:TRINITY_DN12006_c0_g2_i1.p2 TRINITY_DN12006_c0_g2~~TRINITY_DN12006_c0_g2_i1.p2  ORF type:complete len:203 (+),score=32.89 TRINITY_DN12006_c0_g2_i1:68-676(+)